MIVATSSPFCERRKERELVSLSVYLVFVYDSSKFKRVSFIFENFTCYHV